MLISKNLEEKTCQELLSEAIMQIPLYSREWTNYNPSDPGITILENLTVFEALQLHTMNQMTPLIREKLLKMAGFEKQKGSCARVLLKARGLTGPLALPENQGFVLGDVRYETAKSITLPGFSLTGIYGRKGGEEGFQDYSCLLDGEMPMSVKVFGDAPKEGDAVYFVADGLPAPGQELLFYVSVSGRERPGGFEECGKNAFARICWECYTANGYEEMKVKDRTGCFLLSGEVRMRMPAAAAAPCPDVPGNAGYVVRAALRYADYDICPKLLSVDGFLFEAWQKETKSACYTFRKAVKIRLFSNLAEAGYVMAFCKEERGSSYRRYERAAEKSGKGRFYEAAQEAPGIFSFWFGRGKYQYGPGHLKNPIKIMAYSEEMMRGYDLGEVFGYDDQAIELPVKNIVPESFSVLAKRMDEKGQELYDFVVPGSFGENDLAYELLEAEGKIVIRDAGAFIGARLYLGSVSVTKGEEGNIRAGGHFRGIGMPDYITFFNPGPGSGGKFRESFRDVRERFRKDMERHYTAVTAKDYEQLAREAPGLSIDRARAVAAPDADTVWIAVKPDTEEMFPKLSDTYRKVLEKRMEDRRLLTTRVEIVSPAYLPVNVSGVLYVERNFGDVKSRIEDRLRERLDYVRGGREFGEALRFDDVFRLLQDMDCVKYVQDLSLFPENLRWCRMQDGNVIPDFNCLICPGRIHLEIRSEVTF